MNNSLSLDPEMQEIFEGFLVETEELLDNFTNDLMLLENDPCNLDLLNRIFRAVHTIKGTSSFMGFNDISQITHHGEDILNKLRKSELNVSHSVIDLLFEIHDWIVKLVNNLKNGSNQIFNYSETIKKIESIKNKSKPETVEDSENITINSIPEILKDKIENDISKSLVDKKSALVSILENPEIIKGNEDFSQDEFELIQAAFAEVSCSLTNNDNIDIIDGIEKGQISDYQNITIDSKNNVMDQDYENKSKIISEKKLQSESVNNTTYVDKTKSEYSKISNETIRVDTSRVETLMDLSGELVLARNRLSLIATTIQKVLVDKKILNDLSETTGQIDFVTSEIQSAVMRMRMVPIGKLYQKAPRLVRDLAKEFGKKISLSLKGEETEIDRGIIEELNDPLVHMLRNSCDHGIELPENRKSIGKNEYGQITLEAEQKGNNIILKIFDDGKGMDINKLKAKAIEKGILNEDKATQLSKQEIFQLIFHPGFSTAETITNVSGRGVGMDVVRSNIQKLKGIIDIESEEGKGTTFIIKLPLTLAIIQGLLVRIENETYAIPLGSVEEVVSVDFRTVFSINSKEVIKIRESILPLLRLENIFGKTDIRSDINDKYVVVIGLGIFKVGLIVDELLGQQEIVIKSISEFLGKIKGIAGSTILGDGRVIMIIDIAEIVKELQNDNFNIFQN